jgi:hypothetical protein
VLRVSHPRDIGRSQAHRLFAQHPGRHVQLAAMQIGDFVIHGSRRYLLCGFDPEGVAPRMVYVEDVVTRAHSVLRFEDLNLSPSRRGGDLRLVRPSENPHGDLP